ncbi:cysteine hydrolase family protein [Shewanella woodyi]|uniref:Isochorismatase hydrolase n=1 Tax=Shewanella woodyi (strain ATCC 51908 / MS32) TaxID=392500 RepID=B1KF17_SHEWM|nr:cysteine hydrolase [Shewanella woodyi]ACA85168.1 isochorismatase hydrolase [Shewanella woodyi ATCC 51908]
MNIQNTALLLIGYQNDYFAKDGILHSALENSDQVGTILSNSLKLIKTLLPTDAVIAATPIIFTPDYSELNDPIGILKIIKDNGAFRSNTVGAATIDEVESMSADIITLPGKRGLSCFSNTELHKVLQENKITDVIIAGAVTSLCIDTAGREAADLGYRVTIISDCTVARTTFEQEYYLNEIMPLYANVMSSKDIEKSLGL